MFVNERKRGAEVHTLHLSPPPHRRWNDNWASLFCNAPLLFLKLIYLSNFYTQCDVWTHSTEIKNSGLFWWSQSGVPAGPFDSCPSLCSRGFLFPYSAASFAMNPGVSLSPTNAGNFLFSGSPLGLSSCIYSSLVLISSSFWTLSCTKIWEAIWAAVV